VGSRRELNNDPEISDALSDFVDELFLKINADYPLTWAAQFAGDDGESLVRVAHATWASKLLGFTSGQIWCAYAKLDALPQYVKFAPSPKAFRMLCVDVRRAEEEHKRFLARSEQRLLPRPKPAASVLIERHKSISKALNRSFPLRKNN